MKYVYYEETATVLTSMNIHLYEYFIYKINRVHMY